MFCILFCSWYPTFCFLAGVDGTDDSPTPPKAIDPALGPSQDIYGNDTYPGVDGVNIWPMLMAPAAYTSNLTAAHPTLILSHEVILIGDYKLLTAERGNTHQGFFVYENGWQTAARPGPTDPVCGFARGRNFLPCRPTLQTRLLTGAVVTNRQTVMDFGRSRAREARLPRPVGWCRTANAVAKTASTHRCSGT